MADLKTREDLIAALFQAWARHPELRLGQLIVNAAGRAEWVFGIGDARMLEKLNALSLSPSQANSSEADS
jgi:hypothetical protein